MKRVSVDNRGQEFTRGLAIAGVFLVIGKLVIGKLVIGKREG